MPYPKGMPLFLLSFLALALLLPRPVAAEAPRPGETVTLPEGWYRIEPPDTPDVGFVGTLEVGKPYPFPKGEALPSPPPTPYPTMAPRAAEPCREERARYVEELFRMAGIWYAPWALDLVEALGVAPLSLTPWVRFDLYGQTSAGSHLAFAPGVDPFRPLAWDQELRHVGRQLADCYAGRQR